MATTSKHAAKVALLIAKIDEQKAIIAKARDILRDIYDDLEAALESFDRGVEGLDGGCREIEHAIDSLSETI